MGEILGRFHPLVVHLPIGILIAAFIMELASRKASLQHLRKSIPFILQLAIASSILALFTGWIMPKEGEYAERLISLHLWFAVAMTICSVIVYTCSVSNDEKTKSYYLPSFVLTMILLTVTGHFGGSLTHGEGHLTSPLESNSQLQITDVNTLSAYQDIIQPILKQKCASCHNEGKKKGGLIMTTVEDLMKGGDDGPLFVAGDVANSSMIQRILLPLEEDEHMPPEGKKQLSDNEVELLKWWIHENAHFDKKVGELEQPEEIKKILKGYEQSSNSINTKNIKPISQNKILTLKEDGIAVAPIYENSPLAFASFNRDTMLSSSKLKKLKGIASNITELDLSYTNLNDKMMSFISNFKNLQNLKLQHTNISTKGLKKLEKLKHLSSLNLYNTSVDDGALDHLSKIKSLKSLYIWQTEISDDGASRFINNHPLIDVSYKIDTSIFGDAQLKPPLITADKDLFGDTLTVTLSLNFNNVDVYYTLDGTIPDSTSLKYDDPFTISETAIVKAITMKSGWKTSESAEKLLTKVGHKVASVRLQKQPNDKYKAEGASSLIDFVKGSTNFVDGNWLGYEGEHMTASLDLGEVKPVKNVIVSALEATNAYIFLPKRIEITTSNDGQNFKAQQQIEIPIPNGPQPVETKSFLVEFDEHNARYVKVNVRGTLKNPAWHAAPGAKNWIFIDEIMVN